MRETKLAPVPAKRDEDRVELRTRLDETFAHDTPNPAVCVADGFGVRVAVDRGRLVVADGLGAHRRERRYSRATHGLSRLVVLSSAGTVGLEALRWCAGVGIGVVVLDPFGGELHLTSGDAANDDPRLRRAQALAPGTATGLAVSKYLIGVKLAGQAAVASKLLLAPDVSTTILELAEMVESLSSLEEIRQHEAVAANLYWNAWSAVDVRFTRRDEPRVPDNWRYFDGRRSAVNVGTSRSATDPVNALLNYGYRLLEAEGRLACLAVGLDPGLGVLHADMKSRDSMVLDVMEAARPVVDRYVIELLAARPLLKSDFVEDRRGVVRVLPPLTHRIAEAMPGFASGLGPVVEHVAGLLAAASPYEPSVPSVLTRSKHRQVARQRLATGSSTSGQGPGPNPGAVLSRAKPRQRPRRSTRPNLPFGLCEGCGGTLPVEENRGRPATRWCTQCIGDRRREIGTEMASRGRQAAQRAKETSGVLPSHTEEAQQRRRQANRQRELERLEWETKHADEIPDVEWYLREIAPRLRELGLTGTARALGVSKSAVSKYRGGKHVPHPRHWRVLAELLSVDSATACTSTVFAGPPT